jgi:hypothetical protein
MAASQQQCDGKENAIHASISARELMRADASHVNLV